MSPTTSPFFDAGTHASADRLAIVHLKRDHQLPSILRTRDEDEEGYEEGKVLNTRFGSFPHNTLIGRPWGSQVRASKVDTGSRGRRVQERKQKRKRDEFEGRRERPELRDATPAVPATEDVKEAVAATSGFVHLVPPTPENWTSSLPHRTQVVYTPDYSYILHRIRARPGTSLIEAGAGSGSFTHASARAVYHGCARAEGDDHQRMGKVWSYEFHEQRHGKLVKEIREHGLEDVVTITHRDVCQNGFLVGAEGRDSPRATAVFLDLPAPWLALPHLSRSSPPSRPGSAPESNPGACVSPLDPDSSVYLCTFSPCIEQVQRTVSAMRQHGWVDIDMVEVSQKRLEIRRERVGIANGYERGVQATAANVSEAVSRLREVEGRFKAFHSGERKHQGDSDEKMPRRKQPRENPNSKKKIIESLVERKIYKEGRLVHRTETDLKTHTSYLVFAVLPRSWSEDDERAARERWPVKKSVLDDTEGMSKRQLKKAARNAMKKTSVTATNDELDEDNADDDVVDEVMLENQLHAELTTILD